MARPVILFPVPAFYFCTFFNDFSINTDIHIYQFSKNSELYYYLMLLLLNAIITYCSQYFHYLKNKEKTFNYCRNLRWKNLLSLNLVVFRSISCNFLTLSHPKLILHFTPPQNIKPINIREGNKFKTNTVFQQMITVLFTLIQITVIIQTTYRYFFNSDLS